MTFLDLPHEIIALICTSADSSSVKNFRLTCKQYGSIGWEHLPPNVYICNLESDMDRLETILERQHEISWIRSLHLNTTQLGPISHKKVRDSKQQSDVRTYQKLGKMQNYVVSSSFRAALGKMSRLETIFINEIQSGIASPLIEALGDLPRFGTLCVGVSENDLKHATRVLSDLGCKISPYNSGTSGNVNMSFNHIITARSQSVFHELIMLNPGLDLATPLPDIQGRNGLTANLQSFRAKVKLGSSIGSHNPLLGGSIREMKDLKRLELAGSIQGEEDALLPLDFVINDARWKSLRHCTFTGASFSFSALISFLDHHTLEQISFRNLALTGGSWGAILSRLAEVKGSRLQRLDLGEELWADGVIEYTEELRSATSENDADVMQATTPLMSSLVVLRKATEMSYTLLSLHYRSFSTMKIGVDLPVDLIKQYLV